MVTKKTIKNFRTVPNIFYQDFIQYAPRTNWNQISGKPSLVSVEDMNNAISDFVDDGDVASAINTALQDYTDTTTLNADYVSKTFLTNELQGYLQASHTHDC